MHAQNSILFSSLYSDASCIFILRHIDKLTNHNTILWI